MSNHFENLWEKAENFQKDSVENNNTQSIIDELILKINLYKAIDLKIEIPEDERKNIKSRTMGEILYTLTALSLKDNLNVYEALDVALQNRSIDYYNVKYKI